MGQGDQDWLAEAIIDFLRGPLYINPLMSFIDERCLIFTPEEENKFEYTTIHEEFKELVDQLLMDFLAELGLDAEAFYKVVSEAQHEDKLTAFVVQTILTVDDFLMFKAMMVKRNVELTNQVLRLVDEAAGSKAGLAYAPNPASTSVTDTLKAEETEAISKALALSRQVDAEAAEAGKLQAAMRSLQIEDEDVALSLALAASLRDGNALDTEMAELEQAIALSLALEAERLRLLAAQQAAAAAAAGKGGPEPSPPVSDVGKVLATAKVPLASLAPVSAAPQAQAAAASTAAVAAAGSKQPAVGAPTAGSLKAPAPPGTQAEQANADLMMGGALLRAASSVRKTAGAGFKSDPAGSSAGGSSGGVDLASVRDAARLAAESQKSTAGGKGGKGGEEAQRWLTEQKRRLVAAKKQQRDLEMDQYRAGRGMGPGGAEGLVPPPKPDPNDGLEAKRAALRDKLAQKIKENLLGQQQQQQ